MAEVLSAGNFCVHPLYSLSCREVVGRAELGRWLPSIQQSSGIRQDSAQTV